MAKVSIIMSVYNAEAHLKESLESALFQSFKDIEIICVYKESTDHTAEILNQYRKLDQRIVIIEQKTSDGCGSAKNIGLVAAGGDYITFLDADDYYMDPSSIQTLFESTQEQGSEICGGFRKLLNERNIEMKHPLHRTYFKSNHKGLWFNYRDLQYDYHFHSYLYNRKLILENDCRFGELSVYDDCQFFTKAMLSAERFYICPVEMYCYRLHGEYKWTAKQTIDCMKMMGRLLDFTSENELPILHWLTFCRLSEGPFAKNIKTHLNCEHYQLLEELVAVNKKVDPNYLESVIANIPGKEYCAAMDVLPVKPKINGGYYLIGPLADLLLRVDRSYKETLDEIQKTKSYRLSKAIAFLPRRINDWRQSLNK